MKRLFLLFVTACLWPVLLIAQAGDANGPAPSDKETMSAGELGEAESRNARLKRALTYPIPPDLRNLLIENPYASYLVKIGEDGYVKEAMCIGATHFDLIRPGMNQVIKAEFVPALNLGIPVSVTGVVHVRFFDPEQELWQSGVDYTPFGVDVTQGLERRMYNVAPDSYVFKKSKVSELDDLLVALEGELVILEDEAGNKAVGECRMEFYIGSDGKVYFPKVLESEDDLVSMSAIMSLKKFRFQPPTHEGRPTFVQVRQTFRFTK